MDDQKELVRPNLPEKTEPGYVEALVDACIGAFRKFGDDGMSLNYMGVDGKLRPIVLDNAKYRLITKQIMAEKFLEEINEIENISRTLKNEQPKQSSYDMRNPKDSDNFTKDIKETLALRLKVADMRREILNISKSKEIEENDALNIFFIALTPEEFAAMDNVEINEGTDDTKLNGSDKIAAPTARKKFANTYDEEPDPFIILKDGTIEEIMQ